MAQTSVHVKKLSKIIIFPASRPSAADARER